ncbi:MAG: MFS transporter, partial [Lentisphaeraceae bacterium]|nr:MFS transporter [Lentisphaeraceae bacterium]
MPSDSSTADPTKVDSSARTSSAAQVTKSESLIFKGLGLPFALLVIPFALWGAANNMTDLLVPAFQKVMSMSQTQSSLVQMAFYGAYFCMALPAAYIIKRFSYKSGVVAGLFIYAAGAALCYPAAQSMSFNFFLVAFYVFAAGCAFLETAVAPYVISMGPDDTATQRINLAQAFNPIGSLCGIYLGKNVILAGLDKADAEERAAMATDVLAELQRNELSNVVVAYLIIGVISLILALVILFKKFPKGGEEDCSDTVVHTENKFGPTLKRLMGN